MRPIYDYANRYGIHAYRTRAQRRRERRRLIRALIAATLAGAAYLALCAVIFPAEF